MRGWVIALSVSISVSYSYGNSRSYSHSYSHNDSYSISNGNSASLMHYGSWSTVYGPWSMVDDSRFTVDGSWSKNTPGYQTPESTLGIWALRDTVKAKDSTRVGVALRDTVKAKDTTRTGVALRDTISLEDSVQSPEAPRDTLNSFDSANASLVPNDTVLSSNCYTAMVAEERAVYIKVRDLPKPLERVIQFTIGPDTLYDLLALKDTNWHLIKHWPLLAGDTLCANLLDSSLSARWSFRADGVEPVVQNEDLREFTGDIWYYKDVALLRINKTRDYPEKMNIVVGLQPGFDLDRLYLNVKLIHPTAGVKEVEKEVRVSNADMLGKDNRLLRVYIPEWTITDKGKYFIRISHQHLSDRLNGIDFVSYELLTP